MPRPKSPFARAADASLDAIIWALMVGAAILFAAWALGRA